MNPHLSVTVLAIVFSATIMAFCLWLAGLNNEPKKKTKSRK